MPLPTRTTFKMQGFSGMVVLAGIAVNNAIVPIDYTNLLRREHNYPLREAVITAGTRRAGKGPAAVETAEGFHPRPAAGD